jgi:hypothetical protein
MGFDDGVSIGNIDQERDGATKVKLQFHRPGLSFRTEGFWAKVNKADPVAGTDYSPRRFATTLSQAASTGATEIYVASVKGLARYQPITLDRAGTPETKNISAIDVANKKLTLDAGLGTDYSQGATVDMDRVKVSYSNGVTTIDFILAGQNVTAALAGGDVQSACVHVDDSIEWANGDRFDGEIRVPLGIGSSVAAALVCDECYVARGIYEKVVDSRESAQAVDPNYWMRIKFTSAEQTPTEKVIVGDLGIWRV